ncbi:hypothetical protein JCGZ_16233 [Jatropha curcas]|uniref:Uncharacterized protein n=1 Tax=Jatropha curcas TaxID=180498 RepID=A0A067K3E7_JATCU|nr:hypothetical protein JCGZ_16233 [Jatropha curcas]
MESSSGKEKSKSKPEKLKGKEKAKEKILTSRGKGKSVFSPNPLMHSYLIDWKFFGKPEFNFRELFKVQGWMEFLSVNKPCYEIVVKEFYGSLEATGPEMFSMKIDGETRVLSYTDLSSIYKIPNIGSRSNPKKLPDGMLLTPIFDFLGVDLEKKERHNVSKLDSNSLKLKDEEDEEEKEKEDALEKESVEKERTEKKKLSLEKEEAESKKKKRRLEKEKGGLEEAEKEKGEEIEKEKRKVTESEIEPEKEQEKEKGKEAEIKTEAPQDKKDFVDLGSNEPKTTKKDVEYASDVETEKLEISDEKENEPEPEAKRTSEYISA